MSSESELQKLKSTFLALKDTYQDEQAKNLSLVDLLHQNELQIKSLQNEIESLQFQNQQLSKKVSILQEDIQQVSKRQDKQTDENNSNWSADDYNILDHELQQKIRENAQLYLDYEEQKNVNTQLVQRTDYQLQQTRLECENRVKDLQTSLQAERQRNLELQQEKSRLETKLIEYLAEMQSFKAKEAQQIVIESPQTGDTCDEMYEKMKLLLEKYENAEKRAMSFEVESKMLENRLEVSQESLQTAKQQNEALQTSVSNYESQLSAISEYIASLDEKLIRQKDELESLREQLANKKFTSGK